MKYLNNNGEYVIHVFLATTGTFNLFMFVTTIAESSF